MCRRVCINGCMVLSSMMTISYSLEPQCHALSLALRFFCKVLLLMNLQFALCNAKPALIMADIFNCGDNAVLTCNEAKGTTWGWYSSKLTLFSDGMLVSNTQGKYTESFTDSTFSMTVHNVSPEDVDFYRCRAGFIQSNPKQLNMQCKASRAVLEVTEEKKVKVTVDKLYPLPTTWTISFGKEDRAVNVPVSGACSNSKQYLHYYKCMWTSSNSLADGYYTYNLVVAEANPLTGSFIIVSPQTPAIKNVAKLKDSREVVNGIEGRPLTIQCISSGGYPAPTVVWYKDSISSSNAMATTNTGTIQANGTYTVPLNHTFIPTVLDDLKALICRSYYPQADSTHTGSKIKSVILYLTLKPSQPTVSQLSFVSAVEVSCRTTGCRPAANISWAYQGSTTVGEITTTFDSTTETHAVMSLFRRQVTAADNGQIVQCIVTHPALTSSSERTASVNLNVHFSVGPSTTHIRGNQEIIATGNTALTLTCTTGSSNPASDITWKTGSLTLISGKPYTESPGDNNGLVRSQELILHPTRYMDNDNISCLVSNIVSKSNMTDTITLSLKYSPLVTIQGQQQNTLREGKSKQLSCEVNSKPTSTIKWYHGTNLIVKGNSVSNVLNYSLTPISRTHFGTYSCKADNGIDSEQQEHISITVRFRPLTTTITGNKNIIANEQNTLTLVCTSGSSNPVSNITWIMSSDVKHQNWTPSDQSGEYGGMIRQRKLTLTPGRYDDGISISCEAYNSIGTSKRNTVILDLRYRPLIEPMSEVIAVEGNSTILTCVASSKPASTFKWYRGQSVFLHQGTGTLDNNKLTYTIRNVRRTDTETYRCNANNGIESADNENVILTVYYPPVVTVVVEANTTVNDTAALLSCSASGMPNSNYTYGKWIQTWNNVSVSEKPGNEKLELKNLTYEHSGVYTCSASNGIKVFGTSKEFMEGSVLLVVKSFPIITNASEKTPTKLKENATLEVYYYSNAAGSEVKIYRNVNGSKQLGVIYTVSETREEVNLPVFSHIIKTVGTRAKVMIQILSMDELGLYDVVVVNEIGSSTRSFEIVPKGPPSKPSNVTVDSIQYNTAHLSWIRGYHGGLAQTFVIQLSTDLNIWRNITVDGGLNESLEPISEVLSNLYDSTMYYIQMYAFNKEGSSPFTEFLNFTTPPKTEDDRPGLSEAVIGGAAGGISALFVLVLVIVIVLVLKRRGVFTKGKENSHDDKNDRTPVYADEDDYGMQDNPMYVSAGPRNQKQTAGESGVGDGAVYSTVDKNRIVVNSSKNDVYAEVDKTNKTKANKGKEKKEKSKQGFMKDKKGKKLMQDGDLYENATTTEMKDRLAKRNKNEETIYENPEPSKPSEKKNVNKDGLIYADLTFNDQPKGQKKLVIHGLDSMTEYVQVDFTKKADPLPDSDDENNSPKNST